MESGWFKESLITDDVQDKGLFLYTSHCISFCMYIIFAGTSRGDSISKCDSDTLMEKDS